MLHTGIRLVVAVAVLGLSFVSINAEVLSRVEVSAPAVNCLFDPSCRMEVTDSTDPLSIGARGTAFLQSRTFKGQPGSPAQGLYLYEYRIDLRKAEGILNVPCISFLSLNFGPVVRTLDFDGDGKKGEEVFVVTRGGLGSIGLAAVSKSGSSITFQFGNSVCAGGGQSEGMSTYFFGLVSTHSPTLSTATVTETTGRLSKVQARTPRKNDPVNDQLQDGVPVKKPIPIPKNGSGSDITSDLPLQNVQARSPVVAQLRPQPCVDRGGLVTINGHYFGASPQGRFIELGGHGIGVLLQVRSWSDKRIVAIIPDNPRIQTGQWYYIGLQDRDRHWISNISQTIRICRGLE